LPIRVHTYPSTAQSAALAVDKTHIETFYGATAPQIAAWFTAKDYRLFARVTKREFVGKLWTKESGKQTPNVQAMIDLFNYRSGWITAFILKGACVFVNACVCEKEHKVSTSFIFTSTHTYEHIHTHTHNRARA
jgi:hypothetical protein